MKCLVNWIPLNTHVRFENTQPCLKVGLGILQITSLFFKSRVFFKSRLQNDVRRFGRGYAGLFSQKILLNLIKRCSNQHAEIFMNEKNMGRFESVFTN